MPVIWKRPVADQHDRPQFGPGDHHAQRRRHGEAHRRVIRRAEELRLPMDHQVAGGEQRIARVGDHHDRVVQGQVQPARSAGQMVICSAGRSWKADRRGGKRRRQRPRRRLQPGGDQPVDEVGQLHAVVMVVADAEHFAGGVNAPAGIELAV